MEAPTREDILRAKARVTEAQAVYQSLVSACVHRVAPQQPDPQFGDYGVAQCEVCDTRFGWYCPASPDRTCHYFSEDGQVQMITGECVPVPSEHDRGRESEDWCIFCGDPDERK